MNTLIFNMSILNPKRLTSEPIEYATTLCKDGFVYGRQTNEAAAKCVAKHLKDSGRELNRIIAIVSKEAAVDTTLGYFRREFFAFCDESEMSRPDFIPVYAEDKEYREILSELVGKLSTQDVIFFDTSGGKRDEVNIIQLLMKLISYKHIRTELALYSGLNPNYVRECNESDVYLDILDGVNQLATSGKVDLLKQCFADSGSHHVDKLLNAMELFTDSLQMCNVQQLDDYLDAISSALDGIDRMTASDDKRFLLKEMTPFIREKLFSSKNTSDEYCNLVRWCVHNGLVQQALTIYIEKIPKYMFDHGMLEATDELKEKIRKKYTEPPTLNLEATLFYEATCDIFTIGNEQTALDKRVKMFKSLSENYRTASNIDDEYVREAISAVILFVDNYDPHTKYMDYLTEQLKNNNHFIFLIAKINLDQKAPPKTAVKAAEALFTGDKFPRQLLHRKNEERTKDTYEKKLEVAARILDSEPTEGITVHIPRQQLQKIIYDYIYAKALRNQINHASGNENLSESQKALFAERGYATQTPTARQIGEQLLKAVDNIENA